MAEVMSEFPKSGWSKFGRFADGQIWKVSIEEMRSTSVESVRSQAHVYAKSKGLVCHSQRIDATTIAIQMLPKNGNGQK